ncbi:unnamed protein product [Dovyalis caffra]|uniref:Uncharacterized protein n=1 Tax=Dovyalis caffra TaxID=77055 RepID=A0AAV1RHJ2_9ROSI|nr:unnamed protein product [Dovyalis caffra]
MDGSKPEQRQQSEATWAKPTDGSSRPKSGHPWRKTVIPTSEERPRSEGAQNKPKPTKPKAIAHTEQPISNQTGKPPAEASSTNSIHHQSRGPGTNTKGHPKKSARRKIEKRGLDTIEEPDRRSLIRCGPTVKGRREGVLIELAKVETYRELFLDSMGGGAWPFLVGRAIYLG